MSIHEDTLTVEIESERRDEKRVTIEYIPLCRYLPHCLLRRWFCAETASQLYHRVSIHKINTDIIQFSIILMEYLQ